LAGAAKDAKVKVREKFEDTAYWKADIRTDSRGEAAVSFPLPDNLTTWRLTSRGHDLTGRLGESRSSMIVTQDLIARIAKPRFMVAGDKLNLIGILNSNTNRGLESIVSEFRADEALIAPDEKFPLSLPAYGSIRQYYSFAVPEDKKEINLAFTARADKEAADSVKHSLAVESRGSRYKLFGIGDMSANKRIEIMPLVDSDSFRFTPQSLAINIYPSPVAQMLRAAKFLIEYPYGCIEQTLSRFVPALALEGMLKAKGYDRFLDPVFSKKISEKADAGLALVINHQNEDGSWGWWAGDVANSYITGYVMYSLYVSQKSGRKVHKGVIENGLGAMERMLLNENEDNPDRRSWLLMCYSLYGRWHHYSYKVLMDKKNPSAFQLACMLRASAFAKKSGKIKEDNKRAIEKNIPLITASLMNMSQNDSYGIHWPSDYYQRYGWQGGPAEITSHVLMALVDVGDNGVMPSQIVRSLSRRGRGDAWTSTKESAFVLFALCGYLEARASDPAQKGTISFLLNGRNIAKMDFDLERSLSDGLKAVVPIDSTVSGKSFIVEAEGNAPADTVFYATIDGHILYESSGFASMFKSEDKGLRALSNGLSITRSYLGITRVKDLNHNEYMVPQRMVDKKSLEVGDELMVNIRFKASDNFSYLVLEDYLPSGFEVVSKSIYDTYSPYVHLERWDNRMVFFFNDLKKGETYDISYIVRAELPGSFIARSCRMECMYEPSIQGWSSPSVIEVKKSRDK
jgi:hypothetical protein